MATADYADFIKQTELKYGIPSGLLSSLIEWESKGDPTAVGDNGLAHGLCQMHPTACAAVGRDWHQQFSPQYAIETGALYLKQMFRDTGDWRWALGAYNQGPTVIMRAQKYADNIMAGVVAAGGRSL